MRTSPRYEMKLVTLDRQSIKKLELINPRNLRESQIKSLFNALCEGQHFDVNFVVNQKDDTTRVIDGNHRITALGRYFEKHPNAEIQTYCAFYSNLGEDEERRVFTRWNIGISQSIDDFIHSYKDTIPMYTRIITELPCSVYGSLTKLKLKDITNAYFTSFEKPYKGGWANRSRLEFISQIQRLQDSDVDTIIKNFKTLWGIFNEQEVEDVKNIFAFKNIIYRGLYYLVANASCDEKTVAQKMKKSLLNRTILGQYSRFHGRNAAIDAFNLFQQATGIELEVKPLPSHLEKKQKIIKQRQEKNPRYDDEPPRKQCKQITSDLQELAKKRREENQLPHKLFQEKVCKR